MEIDTYNPNISIKEPKLENLKQEIENLKVAEEVIQLSDEGDVNDCDLYYAENDGDASNKTKT